MPPTPTPIPSNQIVQTIQAVQNTVDSAAQQGAITVVIIIAFTVLVLSVAYLVRTYTQRNNKPENSGSNDAIKALAEMATRSDEREERQQGERRQERKEWLKQIEERDKKFTEAVIHLGDGYNRQGDVLDRIVALQESHETDRKTDINTITAMKADVGQVLNLGSVPVRGLVENVARIELALTDITTKVNQLPTTVETAKQEILNAIRKCRESNVHPDTDATAPTVDLPKAS